MMPMAKEFSLREWVTRNQLVVAFGISLLIHAGAYGGWIDRGIVNHASITSGVGSALP